MSRSLKVPGSPSSELHTRNFAPGNWRGMKLHLRPVGKPAPGRFLDLRDKSLRRRLLGEDFLQSRITAARDVIGQPPVVAVEAGENWRVRAVIEHLTTSPQPATGRSSPAS